MNYRLRKSALGIMLWLKRQNPLQGLGIMLALSALCAWTWGFAYLQQQTRAPQRSLEEAQRRLRTPVVVNEQDQRAQQAQQRLAAFYDLLGERRYAEQQVKTLFAIAVKTGLTLSQAEYKPGIDRAGRIATYRIVLPVKGSYEAIRRFCEQTLLAMPYASLDELNFKRESIASNTLDAKLRFTLYLADANTPKPSAVGKHAGADAGKTP